MRFPLSPGLRSFLLLTARLWESSWSPDSVVLDTKTGFAFDASQIKKVEHRGKYHFVSGRSQVHPSPQRTPVLFQAGTSTSGAAFAAKHAEGIFLNSFNPAQATKVTTNMRAAAAAKGRDPASLKFFPCIMPIIGRTREEAQEKLRIATENADPIAGLGQLSGYTGVDFSEFALDEPIDMAGRSQATAIQAVLASLEASAAEKGEPWTPRRLGMRMALGGLHPSPVGTAADVADVMQQWVEQADVDGFNIGSITNPGSWTDVVDLLVPELQRRGMFWDDYAAPRSTFRENLLGTKTLRDDHYGATFKYGSEKAQLIDKLPEPAAASKPAADEAAKPIESAVPAPAPIKVN